MKIIDEYSGLEDKAVRYYYRHKDRVREVNRKWKKSNQFEFVKPNVKSIKFYSLSKNLKHFGIKKSKWLKILHKRMRGMQRLVKPNFPDPKMV